MNPPPEDARFSGAGTPAPLPETTPAIMPLTIDDTLRLMATAPVPAGLEDRVGERIQAALVAVPRHGQILAWPASLWPFPMRAAAAAAIVMVVAGGGWSVYSRVERLAGAAAPAAPQLARPAGGFSTAGAIRTPETVQGPAVQPEMAQPQIAQPEKVQPQGKKRAKNTARHARTASPAR